MAHVRAYQLALRWIIPAFVLSLLFSGSIAAQSISSGPTDNGIRAAFSSAFSGGYAVTGIDTVNLYNGHVSLRLPIGKIGARGTGEYAPSIFISRTLILRPYQYWSYAGNPVRWGDPQYKVISERYNDSYDYSNFQPGFLPFVLIGRRTRDNQPDPGFTVPPSTQSCYTLTKLYLRFSGSEVELRDVLTGGQQHYEPTLGSLNRGHEWRSVDGSQMLFQSDGDIQDETCNDNSVQAMNGINMVYPTGYLLMPDGSRYRFVNGYPKWMIDANGNTMVFGGPDGSTEVTDSIGRKYQLSAGGVTYKDHDGVSESVTVSTGSLSTALRSDFVAAGVKNLQTLFTTVNLESPTAVFDPIVTKSVHLPNGWEYRFFYTEYGELARIELPAGGIIEYDYAPGSGTNGTSVTSSSSPQVYRVATERRVFDAPGHLQSRQTYTYASDSTGTITTVITYDAANNIVQRERHTFGGTVFGDMAFQGWYQPPDNGREYISELLDVAGNVLRRSDNTWRSLDLNGAPTQYQDGQTHPTNLDCALTAVRTTLSDTNQASNTTFTYDGYGNKTDTYEYDFGAPGTGNPGPLIRRTHVDHNYDPSYIQTSGPRFLRLVSRQWVSSDEAGLNRHSTTEFEYDHYESDGRHAPLIDRPGMIGSCIKLDDTGTSCLQDSDSSYIRRGNLTQTISFYDLQNNGSVTNSLEYDVAGNVVKAFDPRGYATTIDFRDNFGSPADVVETAGEPTSTAPAELTGLSTYAFPFKVTNALGHKLYSKFNYYIGRVVVAEDANGIVSSTYFADVLDRPTQVVHGVNGGTDTKSQTTFSYDDVNRVVTTTSDQTYYGDNVLKSQTLYDGLGRVSEKRQYETTSAYITVRQTYDALGHNYQTSNPFRSGETVLWTTAAYDVLGRITSVTTPDTAMVNTYYNGSQVLVKDQAGKERMSQTNALGQLTDVWEITASDSATESISFPGRSEVAAGYRTKYEYDTPGNLTKVTQRIGTTGTIQERTFSYDTLSRLMSATNPESGTVTYQYDENGNLKVRTDARGVSSHYEYDELNRLTRRWYNGRNLLTDATNNIPALPSGVAASDEVKYFYDSQGLPSGAPSASSPDFYSRGYSTGRLVAVTYGGGSAGDYYGYDAAGRVIVKIQQAGGVNFKIGPVTYSLASAITSETYPSNHSVTYNYDAAGRLGDKDAQHPAFAGNLGDSTPRTYAQGISYSSFGGLQEEQLGTQVPIYHKQRYTVRGQLWDMRASTVPFASDPANGDRGAIVNYYSDNFLQGGSGSDNNGNLRRQENYIPGGTVFQDNFAYDSLNRLTSITGNSSPAYKQSYSYDRFGNRTIDNRVINNASMTYGGVNNLDYEVQTGTNRLYASGDLAIIDETQRRMQYDAAGNLKVDNYAGQGQGTRTYDAENRMTNAGVGANIYTYDGDGRRVKRLVGTPGETWQIYGIGGELIAEYAANANPTTTAPQKEYGYRNGQLLITTDAATSSAAAPSGLAATLPTSGTSITLNWMAASGATSYRIERKDAGGSFNLLTTTSSTTFTDTTTTAGSAYLYKVCAANGNVCASAYSNVALGSSVTFPTDPTIYSYSENPGNATSPKAAHIIELRTAVNAVRHLAGMTDGNWTTSVTQGGFINVDDVRDLRTNLDAALTQLGIDTPQYATDPTLIGTQENPLTATTIKAAHVRELRTRATSGHGGSGGGGGSSFQIHWLVVDQLGTPRMIFDWSGSLTVTQNGSYIRGMARHDYLPFGEELFAGTGGRTTTQGYSANDGVRQQFTQKERDNETGLDYFGARYYANWQGRFTSADNVAGNPSNPQTLNLYSYVTNDPLALIDPSGHSPQDPNCDASCQEIRRQSNLRAAAEGAPPVVVTTKSTPISPLDSLPSPFWNGLGFCPAGICGNRTLGDDLRTAQRIETGLARTAQNARNSIMQNVDSLDASGCLMYVICGGAHLTADGDVYVDYTPPQSGVVDLFKAAAKQIIIKPLPASGNVTMTHIFYAGQEDSQASRRRFYGGSSISGGVGIPVPEGPSPYIGVAYSPSSRLVALQGGASTPGLSGGYSISPNKPLFTFTFLAWKNQQKK